MSFKNDQYKFFALKTKANFEDNMIILPSEVIHKYKPKAGLDVTFIKF